MTIELAYLVIDAHDPAAVGAVLTDVVGLMPGEPAAGCATWRNDAKVHRVLVREGASNDVAAAGYELPGPAELAATLDRLRRARGDRARGHRRRMRRAPRRCAVARRVAVGRRARARHRARHHAACRSRRP